MGVRRNFGRGRFCGAGAWSGVGFVLLYATPAAAQLGNYGGGGLQPNLGTRMGDLRPQLEQYFKPALPTSTAPAWQIHGGIGVDIGVTDNALRRKNPRLADVFSYVTPQLVVVGDTSRLKVSLSYAPSGTIYAKNSSQNQFAQSFNGQALATFVPDTVFLDLRGSITQQSLVGGGFNQNSTQTYNKQNSVQTITVSATPYVERRFGGWGTGRVGYSIARSLQDAQAGQTLYDVNQVTDPTVLQSLNNTGYGTTGNLTTQRERASFASGENLGRFNNLTVLEAIQYYGGGSYRGAYRNQFNNELGFALTRQITLLAGLGYQKIHYAGLPPTNIVGPTWNFGGRYNPNPDTTVTLTYGRHDGFNSVNLDGQVAVTPRIRVLARYGTGITTDLEDAQNLLSTTSVGPTGLVTDAATGAPVSGGGSFSGTQNGIFKSRRLSASALYLLDRDSYSLSLSNEERTALTTSVSVLGTGNIPAGTSTNSTSISLSWQHDLAPDLNSVVSASYGVTNSTSQLVTGTSGKQRTISLSASLNKQFTETVSGTLRYTFNDRSGGQATTATTALGNNLGSYTENILLVGLRKSF